MFTFQPVPSSRRMSPSVWQYGPVQSKEPSSQTCSQQLLWIIWGYRSRFLERDMLSKGSDTYFLCICEKPSTAGTSKTWHLTPEQSRWINSTTAKRKNMYIWVNCPFKWLKSWWLINSFEIQLHGFSLWTINPNICWQYGFTCICKVRDWNVSHIYHCTLRQRLG